MDSAHDTLAGGLPHSETPGSKPARGSPGLVAACHVLHRLLAPRHPPDALAFLDPPQRQPRHAPQRAGPGDRHGWAKATTYKKHTHAFSTHAPDGREGGRASMLASARSRTTHRRPKTGLDARERAVITTSRCERSGHRPHRWRQAPPFEARGTRKVRACPAGGEGVPLGFRRPDGPGRRIVAAAPEAPAERWWAWADLNGRPHAYQACALTS
jgi:hypothetical protein